MPDIVPTAIPGTVMRANEHGVWEPSTDSSSGDPSGPSPAHPDAAGHELLGLATKAELTAHEGTPHGGGDGGPHTHALGDLPPDVVYDADLSDAIGTHAATAHGLSSHALDGAYHTGTEVLPTQGQRNAMAGTSGTPGDANRFVTDQDTRLADARPPTAHGHDYATSLEVEAAVADHETTSPHVAPDHGHAAEITAAIDGHLAAATHDAGGAAEGIPAGVIVMWGGLVSAIPSGWALCDGTNGTPDLRDRFVRGAASGANPGATGGSATHQHAAHTGIIDHDHAVAITDPGHAHIEQQNSATTGGLAGWGARDTSTNTPIASGYSTQSASTGITADAGSPAGAVAELPHDAANHEPPWYALAFIQKL